MLTCRDVIAIWKAKKKSEGAKATIIDKLLNTQSKKQVHKNRWTRGGTALTNLKSLDAHFKAKRFGGENNAQHLGFLEASYSTYDWEMLVKGGKSGKGCHALHKKRKVRSPYAREEMLCEKLGLQKLQNEAMRALVQEQEADKIESEQREKELQRYNRRMEHEKEQMQVQMVALQRALADKDDQARGAKRALDESERILRGVQQQQEQHAEDMQVVEELRTS